MGMVNSRVASSGSIYYFCLSLCFFVNRLLVSLLRTILDVVGVHGRLYTNTQKVAPETANGY